MKSTIEELFSVRCPRDLANPSGAEFSEDFESFSTESWSSTHSGMIISNKYPLCGRMSLKNPSYIVNIAHTKAIRTSSNPYVSLC